MAIYTTLGQCSACKHVAYCSLLDDPNRLPLLCDRFEESNSYKGLCNDCENNRDCIFPKTETGKWHCEEYR